MKIALFVVEFQSLRQSYYYVTRHIHCSLTYSLDHFLIVYYISHVWLYFLDWTLLHFEAAFSFYAKVPTQGKLLFQIQSHVKIMCD